MRIATDVIRIFRVMNVGIVPAPNANGDIYAVPGMVALSAIVDDPENATPHTYKWEQTPVTVPGSAFTTDDTQATSFGPVVSGFTYYLSLTVTSARLQTKNVRFRILVP